MTDVKPDRQPNLRAEHAEVTRRRIAAAARTLFARDGYGATTIRAVASAAGVAVQTVYAVYGSKAGILRVLREGVLRQPEAELLYEGALREPDPGRALQLLARSIRRRWETGHDVVAIHEDAAATDPAVRAEVDAILGLRRAGLARFAQSLAGKRGVSGDVSRASAIIDATTLPELYRELVDVHGWTPDAYEAWLAGSLAQQLVDR